MVGRGRPTSRAATARGRAHPGRTATDGEARARRSPRADRNGTRSRTWSTIATCAARKRARPSRSSGQRSLPSVMTRPSVGRSRPVTRRSSVVLPEPDGPVTTWNPPRPKADADGRQTERSRSTVAVAARRAVRGRRPTRHLRRPDRRRQRRRGLGQRRAPASPARRGPARGRAGRADALGDPRPSATWMTRSAIAFDELVVGHDDTRRALGPDQVATQSRMVAAVAASSSPVGSSARRSCRASCHRHGECDALLFAARKLVAERAATPGEADRLEQLARRAAFDPRQGAPEGDRQVDRIGGAQVGRQRPAVVLVDDPDTARRCRSRSPRDALGRGPCRGPGAAQPTADPARRAAAGASTCPSPKARRRPRSRPARRAESRPRRAATGPPAEGWMRIRPLP